jgi:protoporphyrinogen oxidase
MPPDNWIYIQDPSVRLGRLQIFNNWSPSMVADETKIWLGLEYFCDEGDDLWEKPDDEMKSFAERELEKIGLIDAGDVIDGVVIRMPKAYPAYFGTYGQFDEVQEFVDKVDNLYLIGRNGMHRYNNQDHSMLAAKTCVDAIITGNRNPRELWAVNAEEEYHEEK